MDVSKLVDRIKNILLTPNSEWPVIAGESATVPDLYKDYVLVVAAIPPVFGFLKGSLIGYGLFGATTRLGIGHGLTQMVLLYGVNLGLVWIMGLVIDAFAQSFGGERDPVQGFKTAVYAMTAYWVAGIGSLVPLLSYPIALFGWVYTGYLLYLGLPHTMKCPEDKAGGYAAVVVVIGIVVAIAGSAIARIAAGVNATATGASSFVSMLG